MTVRKRLKTPRSANFACDNSAGNFLETNKWVF
jgi:hypothetical protein